MTSDQSLVSLIIPTFNRCEWAVRALESVLRQTYPRWEALVVDDGSSDRTVQRLLSFCEADGRIRLLRRTRPPKGASTCRNIGLEAATGEFVVFLDSDDLLAPECLKRRVQAMQREQSADFIAFPVLLFREKLDDARLLWNIGTAESDLGRFLRGDSVWPINAPIWRRRFLKCVGGFDETLQCWQDVDLHVRAFLLHAHYGKRLEGEPDAFVRLHSGESISQKGLKSREKILSMVRICVNSHAAFGRSASLDLRNNVLSGLLHALELSVLGKQFGLSREIVRIAKKQQLINGFHSLLWAFILTTYELRLHALLGGRRLNRNFMLRFRRKTTIALHPYTGPLSCSEHRPPMTRRGP